WHVCAHTRVTRRPGAECVEHDDVASGPAYEDGSFANMILVAFEGRPQWVLVDYHLDALTLEVRSKNAIDRRHNDALVERWDKLANQRCEIELPTPQGKAMRKDREPGPRTVACGG